VIVDEVEPFNDGKYIVVPAPLPLPLRGIIFPVALALLDTDPV